jgi:hypothetical protein
LVSIRFNARAQAVPPKPPPTTIARAADCAREIEGRASKPADTVTPRRASRRVTGRAFMGVIRKMARRLFKAAAPVIQANVMFWSRSGTERMRLPVAAK